MAISSGHEHMGMSHESDKARGVAVSGSATAAVAGIAAIVLSILGLIGMAPVLLLPITTIVIGAALVLEGGSIAGRLARVTAEVTHRSDAEFVGEGMAIESLGGLIGIILGILALIGTAPLILVSAATIIFGASLLLESGANTRLNTMILREGAVEEEQAHRLAYEAVTASAGSEVLFGLGGIVLGILALIGFYTPTLLFVAMLCFGCAVLLSGSAVTGKMLSAFNR